MPKITRRPKVELELSPYDVAKLFCDMDGDDQARFFNHVKEISDEWKYEFVMQLQYVTDSKELTNDGRSIMSQIGEYSTS